MFSGIGVTWRHPLPYRSIFPYPSHSAVSKWNQRFGCSAAYFFFLFFSPSSIFRQTNKKRKTILLSDIVLFSVSVFISCWCFPLMKHRIGAKATALLLSTRKAEKNLGRAFHGFINRFQSLLWFGCPLSFGWDLFCFYFLSSCPKEIFVWSSNGLFYLIYWKLFLELSLMQKRK